MKLPTHQVAVQLIGPNALALNSEKPVPQPGPHQIIVKTEAVGLCFSDMKLLSQFDAHPRKSAVIDGLSSSVLSQIDSYVPGILPTVPGHEVVCRVVAVGESVEHYKMGERWIVQADYRPLKTTGSNGAFGYNFEGGLQEYILLDERVIGDPNDPNGFMIAVPDSNGASQLALVEPWACVENSYVTPERRSPLDGGRLLIVCEDDRTLEGVADCYTGISAPREATLLWNSDLYSDETADFFRKVSANVGEVSTFQLRGDTLEALPTESFDDILYFGSSAETLRELNHKLAKGGILNAILDGRRIGENVEIGIGRVHYGNTRWIGTLGSKPNESYSMIPETGEIRKNDRILVVGAGGPMGQMHVIRNVSSSIVGTTTMATDVSESRLSALEEKVKAINRTVETTLELDPNAVFSYFALMVPVASFVADAISRASEGAIINVFAGIPAPTIYGLDFDKVIEKQLFLFGTSGSEPRDMRSVLDKVVAGSLDTNTSVAAVSGMAGATKGLRAVEERTMEGKIVVYPSLTHVDLISLPELEQAYPTVYEKLNKGQWTKEAEDEFLRVAEFRGA